MKNDVERRYERLYFRALRNRHEHGRGVWLPIMRHLALRDHVDAMIELADWLSVPNTRESLGVAADAFGAAGLYRRAYRKGDARAARNMAMSCFNRDDLAGYRRWLRLAASAGDRDSAAEIKRFETRLWHGAARDIGRGRPRHKRDHSE